MKTNKYNKVAIGGLVALAIVVGFVWPQYQKNQTKKQATELQNLYKSMANQDDATITQSIMQYMSYRSNKSLKANTASAAVSLCSRTLAHALKTCRLLGEDDPRCDAAWIMVQEACGSLQAKGTTNSDPNTIDTGMTDIK